MVKVNRWKSYLKSYENLCPVSCGLCPDHMLRLGSEG